jgi:tRNA pseudouridine synthase 10
MELQSPHSRNPDLNELAYAVNQNCKSKVEVQGLSIVNRDIVRLYKSQPRQKVYRLKIKYEGVASTQALENALTGLTGSTVKQQTPKRVVHRRADVTRNRTVVETRLVEHTSPEAVIEITCDGGLYVKELVNGDEGRTRPSLSELLEIPVSVLELDVLEVKETNYVEVAR